MLANKIRTKLLLKINKDLINNNKRNIVLINSYNPKEIQKNYLKDIATINLKTNLYHNSSKQNFLSTSFNYLETSDTTENDSFTNDNNNFKDFDVFDKKKKKNNFSFAEKKIIVSQKKLNIKKKIENKNKINDNSNNIINEHNQNYYIKKLRNYSKTLILPKKRKGSFGNNLLKKKLFELFENEIDINKTKTNSVLYNDNYFSKINNEINFEKVKYAFNKAKFILNDKNEIEIKNDLNFSYTEKKIIKIILIIFINLKIITV